MTVRHTPTNSSASSRPANDRLTLELLAQHGPMTRSRLGELSSLPKPTIVGVINRLTAEGLIVERGESSDARPGPRARRYSLAAGLAHVAGVHVTATQITAAVSDVDGTTGDAASANTELDAEPTRQILDVLDQAAALADVDAASIGLVVVGVHGVVDSRSGDLGFAWDLPAWRDRLLKPLTERFGSQIRLVNEVELAAVAEDARGAGRDEDEFAFLWAGQGLGLSYLVDGIAFAGATGAAGQIGYLPVPGAPLLPTERHDGGFHANFQALAGAEALLELADSHGVRDRDIASTILRAVDAGDSAFLDDVAARIATGLIAVAALMDPGAVVLGGETGAAGGQPLATRVEQVLTSYSPFDMRVVPTAFGVEDDPTLQGALLAARSAARDLHWGAVGR